MRGPALIISLIFLGPLPAEAQDVPWRVPATASVVEKEIRFESEGIELYGVLHAREDVRDGPALVALHGSGTPEHDSWLFEHLVEVLPPMGLAVFVYDRRGTGESGGEYGTTTYQSLADDGLAAAEAIGRTEHVSRRKVGFWGQSQGGWLAMEAGARGEASFVINWAGPLETPAEQNYFVIRNSMKLGGHDDETAARAVGIRRAVDEYVRGEREYAETRDLVAVAEEEEWFERSLLSPADALPTDVSESGWRRNMDYDPIRALERLETQRVPTWIVYGGADPVIPVARSLEVLEERFAGSGEWLDVTVIEDADHVLMFPDDPDFMDSEVDEDELGPESDRYFAILGAWLHRTIGPRWIGFDSVPR